MFGLFDFLKIGVGALLGAALLMPVAYQWGKGAERQRAGVEAAHNALNRIKDMEKNNADFLALPDRQRCLVFMRDSGLPESECDQRLGIPVRQVQ